MSLPIYVLALASMFAGIIVALTFVLDRRADRSRSMSTLAEIGLLVWAAILVVSALVFLLPQEANAVLVIVLLAAGPVIVLLRSREQYSRWSDDPRLLTRMLVAAGYIVLLVAFLGMTAGRR